jgi:type III secretion protein Q
LSVEPRAMPKRLRPVGLRRIDAIANVRHRLTRPYRARCNLADGAEAELLISEDTCPTNDRTRGLPLSTRFGPAVAFDYGALLLACTGVDIAQSTQPSTQAALACYGFAALEPKLRAALGDPTVSDTAAAALACEPTFAIHLSVRLPSIRLTMRWVMSATGLHALLDSEPWRPLASPASVPAWLATTHTSLRLAVGESTLPLAECNGLACGDIVRVSTSSFDVAGHGTVRVASHHLQLRWLNSHRCFELENMTHAPTLSSDNPADYQDDITGVATSATTPIDTAAIPVRLSFSLGTLRLTVADVAALRVGSLLELARGMPPAVTIEANGLAIGAGELVDLDGRLAVEITQWPSAGVPASAS